ncbi:MAG: TetR/AcrR family transcriptional regulator [Vulcanimicrobiaceae bacterium]
MQAHDSRLESILDSVEALFARDGYHATSMRDIAEASGISVAGIYYYIPSKQDALAKVCERIFDRLDAGVPRIDDGAATALELLQRFVRSHLRYVLANDSAYRVLLHDMELLEGVARARVRTRKRNYFGLLEEMMQRIDPGARFTTRVAAGALFGMLNWAPTWYRAEIDGNCEQITDALTSLFLGGLLASGKAVAAR